MAATIVVFPPPLPMLNAESRGVTVAAAPLAVRGREIATGEVQGHITSPGDLDGEWTLDERMWTLEKAELTNKDTYRVTLERDL